MGANADVEEDQMKDHHKEAVELARRLPDEELRVWLGVGRRIEAGMKAYEPFHLATDRRNFKAEAAQEYADGLVYEEADAEREILRRALVTRATEPAPGQDTSAIVAERKGA